jgi:hypothetical protein
MQPTQPFRVASSVPKRGDSKWIPLEQGTEDPAFTWTFFGSRFEFIQLAVLIQGDHPVA